MMWNTENIQSFWRHYDGEFAGDTNAREIYRLSRKHIKGNVLDIGAGSGALINLIPHAVGLDIVSHNSRIIEGSIDNLPFENDSMDTIITTDVLEHLTDETLDKGLKEIRRVLKIFGRAILFVPYNENLKQSTVFCPNCHAEFHRWGHLRTFNETFIRDLIRKYDFEILDFDYLPLSLMAQHRLIRYFWRFFVSQKIIKESDIFIVVGKGG